MCDAVRGEAAPMRIGVVLCTYNGERYLQAQLDSILAQNRLPDEVLVQDDGSSDATVEILESWAAQAPFPVRILRNRANLGFVRNFEQAIVRCGADIIVPSDQDDYWRPDKLQRIDNVFAADDRLSVVFSDAEMVDETLKPLGYGLLHALNVTRGELRCVQKGDFLPIVLRRNVVAGATMALRGARKDRWLPIPDGAYHDEWITLIAAACGELGYCSDPLIQYRQHTANQLGARRGSVAERLRRTFLPMRKEDLRRLEVMENLLARLTGVGSHADVVRQVQGELDHLRVRTSLPPGRLYRLTPILRELFSGRYSRYSSGWRRAVRDLVSS